MAYTKTVWEDLPSEDTPITSANLQKIEDALAGMLDYFYPVGTIYETTSNNLDTTAKMASHFGGTWEAYGAGRVLVAKSADTEFDTIGETGGAKTHTLTEQELASHRHYNNHYGVSLDAPGYAGWEQDIASGSGGAYLASAYSNYAGGGQAHNNLQPYIVVYRYRRTA